MRPLLVLSLLFTVPLTSQAQGQPRLDVTLNPREVTVGDPIEAVLTLHAPAAGLSGDPRFPVWTASWGDAEILATKPPEKTGEANGTVTWEQRIVLVGFRTGKIDLPPVAVAVPLKASTLQVPTPAGLGFDVRSVLPANEKDPRPKPAAPLRQLPIGAAFWWTLAGLSALCGLLLWGLWRQSRRRAAEAEAARPALPPFDELAGTLDALETEPSMLRLHTRLSLALRQYLSRTLGVPALESTTSEVHRTLVSHRLAAPLVRQTVELLRACDLVKFARQEVGESRGRERVAAARQLARDLDKALRPPEPVAPPLPLEKAG
jgi:hypothetical protein